MIDQERLERMESLIHELDRITGEMYYLLWGGPESAGPGKIMGKQERLRGYVLEARRLIASPGMSVPNRVPGNEIWIVLGTVGLHAIEPIATASESEATAYYESLIRKLANHPSTWSAHKLRAPILLGPGEEQDDE